MNQPGSVLESIKLALNSDGTSGRHLDALLSVYGRDSFAVQKLADAVLHRLADGRRGRRRLALVDAGQPQAAALQQALHQGALPLLLAAASETDRAVLAHDLVAAAALRCQALVLALDVSGMADVGQSLIIDRLTQAQALGDRLGLSGLVVVPVDLGHPQACASLGQAAAAWSGPRTLAQALGLAEARCVAGDTGPLRLLLSRPVVPGDGSLQGVLLQGTVAVGDAVRLVPSGQQARVLALAGGHHGRPGAGDCVTLRLDEAAQATVGDWVCAASDPLGQSDLFSALLVVPEPGAATGLAPGRCLLRVGPTQRPVAATLLELQTVTDRLGLLQAQMQLDELLPFDPAAALAAHSLFSLHARGDGPALAWGGLHESARAATHIHRQAVGITKQWRAQAKAQRPCVLWFTGLSGAGKSTIANRVEQHLAQMGRHTYLLDGDNVRHGLNRDLGFSDADRAENIRRVAEVARLMVDAGLIVLTAFISPFRSERALARRLMDDGEFIEIHVDAPLALAEQRDVKGLYRKARRGELKGFTGIDAPYEAPEQAELRLDTSRGSAESAALQVVQLLLERGLVGPLVGPFTPPLAAVSPAVQPRSAAHTAGC